MSFDFGVAWELVVGHQWVGLSIGDYAPLEAGGGCLVDVLGDHVVSELSSFLGEHIHTSMKWARE